jgi:hypothetical protein
MLLIVEIYKDLLPETQQALLEFSKRLLETQNKGE